MNKNKVIACDLDGTLAPSKSNLESDMADVICKVLQTNRFAVISGGSYAQYQKQFLSHLSCKGDVLAGLYLFPTNGSRCYVYNIQNKAWEKLYEENLTDEEKKKILDAFKKAMDESGIDLSSPYGEILEDRGGQITFSARGQEAPLEVKEVWDKDKLKRQKIVSILERYIPEFEIRIGGATSIDVTHKGITKAYAIRKIESLLGVPKEDIVFIGDALFPGGNDSSARETGVECIPVTGPEEAKKILLQLVNTPTV